MSSPEIETVPARVYRKPDPAARRQRLRDFQAQLVERMQQARTGRRTQTSQLGLQIGPLHCLLDLREAGEIVSVGTITAVPLTRPWFLGLTNVRGNLVSVVDLAGFLGHVPTQVDKQARIVAFGPALAFNSALLVTRVMGLRDVATMAVQEATQDDSGPVLPWLARCYRDGDGLTWHQLDLAAIVQVPQFLQVGA